MTPLIQTYRRGELDIMGHNNMGKSFFFSENIRVGKADFVCYNKHLAESRRLAACNCFVHAYLNNKIKIVLLATVCCGQQPLHIVVFVPM